MATASTTRPKTRTGRSTVRLDDSASTRRDDSGKSVAFFCQRLPARVDQDLLEQLKRIARDPATGGKNVRLCLHDGPGAAFHEMVILERKGRYYRPHKHLTKGESYHLIEGSMAAFIFEDDGTIADACVLDPSDRFLYRVGTNMYHAILPLSDWIVYHESKPGPFTGEGDSVYPAWAPDGRDASAVAAYVRTLHDAIKGK